MSKVKIELNRSGVAELMKSTEMQQICLEYAQGVLSRCGGGYESDIHVGKNRCNAMVWADSARAKRDNMKNNTLLRALK